MRRLLQSPIVVGILVVMAIALIGRNFLGNRVRQWLSQGGAAPQQTAAAPAAQPAASAAPQPQALPQKVEPQEPIATHELTGAATNWMEHPPRDPFRAASGRSTGTNALGDAARLNALPVNQQFDLTALWRQTGQALAIINGKVLSEGESIGGYQVIRIEDQSVTLKGPRGEESLLFSSGSDKQKPTTTNTGGAITPNTRR